MPDFNIFKTYRIKVSEMLQDTITFLQDKFKQSNKIFTVSSPYGQQLYVQENLSQLMFYYVEDSITELSMREATRTTSKYSLAAIGGYSPTRSISAIGELFIKPKDVITVEIPNNIVILPNYMKLQCVNNGLAYSVVMPSDEMRIYLASKKSIRATVYQGYIETQTRTGTGLPYQSFSINFPKNYMVDEYMLNVYVDDVKVTRYKRLFDMPRADMGYTVRTGATSGFDLFFGNGNFGRYPLEGSTIRVEYLINDGSSGRIRLADKGAIQFKFIDTGFDVMGNEIDLNELIDLSVSIIPDFGADPEPIEITQQMMSKNPSLLINPEDYELLIRRLGGFTSIKAWKDKDDDRAIDIFMIPDIKQYMANGETYFDIDESRFMLTSDKKAQLLAYIERMGTKMMSIVTRMIDPVISKYVLNINIIVFDDVDPDAVKSSIISYMSDYFIITNRKDRLPKSDMISIVEAIDGVDSVNINIVSKKDEDFKAGKSTVNGGIDSFGDIIIDKGEFPLIRGGWSDSAGNYYDAGISEDEFGAINIKISDIVPRPKINNY
jgi:hypothetical protein